MKISVDIDTQQVVKLTSNFLRQFPYAVNNAINRTAKEAAEAAKIELGRDVQLRKSFLANRLRILQYSKVGNLTAVVGLNTNVQGAPLILGFLEEGGTKDPIHGGDVAVPLTGEAPRPTFPQSVVTSLRYTNLRFDNRRGRKRTYIVPGVGIFQRIASGDSPSATKLIYSFKPSVKLPAHTRLRAAMLQIIGERFNAIFSEEFTRELLQKAASL